MKSTIKKIINRLSINKNHIYTIKHNIKIWSSWKRKSSTHEILCDFTSISEATISFSYFSNVLAKRFNARIIPFVETYRSWHLSIWMVYKSFNATGMIYCLQLNRRQREKCNVMYLSAKEKISTKRDALELRVNGVWIGIDIYESYLRTYSKPTIDLHDPLFWKIFKDGIAILIYWQDYFKSHKVAAVIVSHDCYISMNIVCKIAYSKEVPVYSPTMRGFYRLDSEFMTHKYFSDYHKIFNNLELMERFKGIEWAKERLKRKFAGEIGVDMSYSTQTGYKKIANNEKKVLRKSDKIKILIASHCFFDNPHAFGEFMFTDFHEWLHFLGKISNETDYDWYLKSHPDPLPGTFEVLNEITSEYPNITIIPHDTSHYTLINEGINFVLTAHGTIGHEYPYFGIPVINAAYNPHIAYNFCIHVNRIENYKEILLNLKKIKHVIQKEEIFEFYFMHYKYRVPDDLMLPSYSEFIKHFPAEVRISFAGAKYFIDNLTKSSHETIVAKIEKYLDSGKSWYFSNGPI